MNVSNFKKYVTEYDPEIPHSQTADQHRHREVE